MRLLSNLSIRGKVLAAFAAAAITTAVLGLFAIDRMAVVNGSASTIRDNWLPAIGHVGTAALNAELRLGIIGTDTSHVSAFTKILNDDTSPDHISGARVVAAYKRSYADSVPTYPIIASYAGIQEGYTIREYCSDAGKAVKARRALGARRAGCTRRPCRALRAGGSVLTGDSSRSGDTLRTRCSYGAGRAGRSLRTDEGGKPIIDRSSKAAVNCERESRETVLSSRTSRPSCSLWTRRSFWPCGAGRTLLSGQTLRASQSLRAGGTRQALRAR